MRAVRSGRSFVAALALAALLLACSSAPEPFPGSGPGGKPMRTATETAVGLPPAANERIYALNARGRLGLSADTHGPDTYRWLEQADSPQVSEWLRSQNAQAQARLDALPARQWLQARLAQLWNTDGDGLPLHRGGRYFYLHTRSSGQAALMVSDGPQSSDRVLFDPAAGGSGVLRVFSPDAHGAVVAYALDEGGESVQWHFIRTADGGALADTVTSARRVPISWAADDAGVYYTRLSAAPPGAAAGTLHAAVYYHRLGSAADHELPVYDPNAKTTYLPFAQATRDGRYLVITLLEDSGNDGVELLDLRAAKPHPQHLFAAGEARWRYVGAQGAELFFQSTREAPFGRVVAVDPGHAAVLRTVVPESAQPLVRASLVGDRLIARYVEQAHSVVRLFTYGGQPQGEVALPGAGSVSGFDGMPGDAETFFSYTDYLTPLTVVRLDVSTAQHSAWRAPAASRLQFTTEQLFYTSKDGTRIALFLTHRRDAARDGNQSLLLSAGDGSRESLMPRYRPEVQAWLEMGGSYAEADLQAGESDATNTHTALQNQRVALSDFVAAAEYLAAEHYTRSARLAVVGFGRGAALIGAALTQHPQLFGVALPLAGDAATPGAHVQRDALTASRDSQPEQAEPLLGYPPPAALERNCYPQTLITAAQRDDLIAPWRSYELAAAVQAAQSCGNPVLLQTPSAQLPAGLPANRQIEELAQPWAFAAAGVGLSAPAAGAP